MYWTPFERSRPTEGRRVPGLAVASWPTPVVACGFLLVLATQPGSAQRVQTLQAIGGLPAHLSAVYDGPTDFQRATSGEFFVFDRRGHAVHRVDASRIASRKVTEIGGESGNIIQPSGFDLAPDGRFVVADVPRAQQRVQTFDADGRRLGDFFLPGRPAARVVIDNLMLNGAGSVQHTGTSLLISHPESGALFTEYTLDGTAWRRIGLLRSTRFDEDRELHIAMNAGLPLEDPTGGYFYVFVTGIPLFRKYDRAGELVFERHIEGVEIDGLLASQPTRWPRRAVDDEQVPFVAPIVRAAAVDARGRLWVSLSVPYTYVYDTDGDKVRTVQFRGASLLSPTSLSFAPDGRLLVTPGLYEFDPD